MISLSAYRLPEDAWSAGVEDWCRAATPFVLGGGRAWLVTAGDGQTQWIKQRLLAANVSLFGVQFLDARSLRRELCVRANLPPPALGVATLRFLLRLHAINASPPGADWSAVARHPEACLSALDDLAAAGWLDEPGLVDDLLPAAISDWLPRLRATGAWTPDVDQQLADFFASAPAGQEPLSICIFGWDASAWGRLTLLTAAVRAAASAALFLPLPGVSAESIQQSWLEACGAACGVERIDCDDSGFVSDHAALADRLEGVDLGGVGVEPAAPALLTGVDVADTVVLVRDYVARWLAEHPAESAGGDRLAILCPRRGESSVLLTRALTAAQIAVHDEVGELPQPALAVQIQRALVDYHLEGTGLASLLVVIELLNEHAASGDDSTARVLREVFPLDPVEVRRALRGAFAEVQHHSARLLSEAMSFARAPVAGAARRLIDHLGVWPEFVTWRAALDRWQQTLAGLGLSTEPLEPLWSRLADLAVSDPIPSAAFLRYLGELLGGVAVQRDPEASHRFARVVVTTLAEAVGQTWGGVVWLDSNEGVWPSFPPENPFLGDASRAILNAGRASDDATARGTARGHLLTAADLAQLEQAHFVEILQNCRGPLAFAAVNCDSADPHKALYPNEWVLRSLVAAGHATEPIEGKLLDRWRRTVRQTIRPLPALAKNEQVHLHDVWTGRRRPDRPFDEYFLNFSALHDPDELPWGEVWSAAQLDNAWARPATFALEHVLGAQSWHDDDRFARRESWAIGRLVHRGMQIALDAPREPRRLTSADWTRALTRGLPRARAEAEHGLRAWLESRAPDASAPGALPLWWEGVLNKAAWATRRCLETLAETAAARGDAAVWVDLSQRYHAALPTSAGPLRLRAQCDVVLLDRPEMAGAVCQLIDIRAGVATASTASRLAQGKGLRAVATLLLAVAAGADPDRSRAGSIHPDSIDLSLAAAGVAALAQPVLEGLARQQRALVFGQKGALVDVHNPGQAETLPLATSPVAPAVLAAKARLSL